MAIPVGDDGLKPLSRLSAAAGAGWVVIQADWR